MSDEENTGGRGNIGNEIFDQVEAIVRDEGITRTQAFQQLSERTGRRAGTVAANYYRVARKRGATLQPRAPRGSGGRRRRAGGGQGDVDAALARASAAIQELSGIVRDQQKELTSLREQAERLSKLRDLVRKGI
ncbi:MAG: hypothetical protein AB7V42_04965 [Thermoleophilia bacterium]